jgi:non-canonical (house-cleaning) NTP pyrophosphatase
MATDLKDFWVRLQRGVEVAVAGTTPDKLLGVRDGLLRFFSAGLGRSVSVAVVPQAVEEMPVGLLVSDEEVVRKARNQVAELEGRLGAAYHFFIGSEAGIETLDVDGQGACFIRYWTVVRGTLGEAWGASGSVQLPAQLVAGPAPGGVAVAGTRRKGGLIASLTGNLENRRTAIAQSTLHAFATLFYGVLDKRPR